MNELSGRTKLWFVLAECKHMQVSTAGDRIEHVLHWSVSAKTDHCQTFHPGRRMLVQFSDHSLHGFSASALLDMIQNFIVKEIII